MHVHVYTTHALGPLGCNKRYCVFTFACTDVRRDFRSGRSAGPSCQPAKVAEVVCLLHTRGQDKWPCCATFEESSGFDVRELLPGAVQHQGDGDAATFSRLLKIDLLT